MKIKKTDLYIIVLGLIILHLAFINISVSHISGYMNVRVALAIIGAIMLIKYGRMFLNSQYNNLNVVLLLWAFSALLSPFIYKRGHINPQYIQSIVFTLSVVETFFYFQVAHFNGKSRLALEVVCRGFIFYCLLSDILMFAIPSKFYALAGRGADYLIGNKFLMSYAHIFMLAFWNVFHYDMKKSKKLWFNVIGITWTLYISSYTECTTAVVGVLVYAIMMVIGERFGEFYKKPIVVFGVLGISDSLLILNTAIMSIPAVYNLITNILHEDLTFNLRLQAYAKLLNMIQTSPWFGFGIENNYPVSMQFLNIANAQNGLFDNMVSFGLVGTILMLVLFYKDMKSAEGVKCFSIWALVYTLIIMSTVETTLNLRFYTVLAVLAVASTFEDETPEFIKEQERNRYN